MKSCKVLLKRGISLGQKCAVGNIKTRVGKHGLPHSVVREGKLHLSIFWQWRGRDGHVERRLVRPSLYTNARHTRSIVVSWMDRIDYGVNVHRGRRWRRRLHVGGVGMALVLAQFDSRHVGLLFVAQAKLRRFVKLSEHLL